MSEYPTIQEHMSAAYGRWQGSTSNWSRDEFFAQLSPIEAAAVRIGNFNYQVENGGFGQYWGNSYALESTVEAMKQILLLIRNHANPGSPELAATDKVLSLYVSFDILLQGHYDPNRSAPGAGIYDEDEDDWNCTESRIEGARLDHQYYVVCDAFMAAAEAWLRTYAAEQA